MSKQRNTVQRQIILDALLKLDAHPAVDEVYAAIHPEHPSVSISTIYRNLRRLAKEGVIRQVALPDGLERYDANTCRHYHFKCKCCCGVYDVDLDYLAGIDDAVQGKYGFVVEEHDVAFSGLCTNCTQISHMHERSNNHGRTERHQD